MLIIPPLTVIWAKYVPCVFGGDPKSHVSSEEATSVFQIMCGWFTSSVLTANESGISFLLVKVKMGSRGSIRGEPFQRNQ